MNFQANISLSETSSKWRYSLIYYVSFHIEYKLDNVHPNSRVKKYAPFCLDNWS